MTVPVRGHLSGTKNEQIQNMLLHILANAAASTAALTAEGQNGYQSDINRPLVFAGAAIRQYLLDSDLLTDTGLAGATNATVPSSLAVKTYIDTLAIAGVEVVGAIDASGNPNYPAATQGNLYYVDVAGKLGGASGPDVAIGDGAINISPTATAAGNHATVGSNWIIIPNVQRLATTLLSGAVRLGTAAEVTAGTATDAVPTIADVTAMVASSTAPAGSETQAGVLELADNGETVTGTSTTLATHPAGVAAAIAAAAPAAGSETVSGLLELADNGETVTGTDTVRATHPAGVAAAIAAAAPASATAAAEGLVELATDAEARAMTDTVRALTAANLAAMRYTGQFGDGAATSYTQPHGLGAIPYTVRVVEVATGADVIVKTTADATNVVIGDFAVAPTANQYVIYASLF